MNGKENGEWIKTSISDFMIYDEMKLPMKKGIYLNGIKQGEWKQL